MPTPYESADLVLKLYELRREVKMREAREWFGLGFNPRTVQDVMAALQGPQSAYLRMVTSYWDMAAALVNHGAIDAQMFADTNNEYLVVFAKLQPFLADLRAAFGPHYLAQLEGVVARQPGAMERLAALRERFRELAARRAAEPIGQTA